MIMSILKCCWNCHHCDTFAGICHKDKFINDVKVVLEEFSCDKFKGES